MLDIEKRGDGTFAEISGRAKKAISEYFGEWTDLNAHDPGITLIELFSWLTEMQRYFIESSAEAQLLFSLFDVKQLHAAPAMVCAELSLEGPGEELIIPAGTPVFAENTRFELTAPTAPGTGVACFKQLHSLCETLRLTPEEHKLRAGTYLSISGENMLFAEKNGAYERVLEFEKTVEARRGEAVFSLKDDTGEVLLVSCEREYLHNRVLGTTRGFPNQRLKVEAQGRFIVYNSFSILISDSFDLDAAVIWEKTDSLHRSGPSDRHYELDEQTGEIVFGDGFHGRMPVGIVMIAALAMTEGSRGNIKAGGLGRFEYAGRAVQAYQREHADAGHDRESAESALKRVSKEDVMAVTAGDYEAIVKSTPGLMVERVAAFVPEGDTEGASFPVTLAVKPYGERAELSQGYRKRILEWLEPHRLAGTRINVEPPVYVNVRLTAELSGRTYWSDTRPVIEKKLRAYFVDRYADFGAHIRFGEVLAFLDSLPEVTRALSLHMRADEQGAVTDNAGNITLEQRCIACLEQVDVFVC